MDRLHILYLVSKYHYAVVRFSTKSSTYTLKYNNVYNDIIVMVLCGEKGERERESERKRERMYRLL